MIGDCFGLQDYRIVFLDNGDVPDFRSTQPPSYFRARRAQVMKIIKERATSGLFGEHNALLSRIGEPQKFFAPMSVEDFF